MRKVIGASLLLLILGLAYYPQTALAYNRNKVLADAVMDNYKSMSASQINNFLNKFPNSCISPDSGFAAIKPTGYNPDDGYVYGSNVTAGTVIYSAAQAYKINPQVLLTTLQKEQSLVTGAGGCSTNTIAKSMGYGCPDGGKSYTYKDVNIYTRNGKTYTTANSICVNSAAKVGFSQQIIHAAWMLKYSEKRSEGNIGWAIVEGSWDNSDDLNGTYSGYMTEGCFKRSKYESKCTNYDGYATIDGVAVHMDTGATAALYRYTPHFSGNQHFDDIFTDWFGPIDLIFTKMKEPRWMQTEATTYKKVPGSGETIDSGIPAKTPIYFTSKITVNGQTYLRTKHDTDSVENKGILLSDLENVPIAYQNLSKPRWMQMSRNAFKHDPTTEEAVGTTIPQGTQVYFPTKFDLGGKTYLRTQHDTDMGYTAGVLLSDLSDSNVTYEPFLSPRWTEATKDTYRLSAKNGDQIGSRITAGTQLYFRYKMTVNGTVFVSESMPNDTDYSGLLLSEFKNVSLSYPDLKYPRTLVTNSDVRKTDLKQNELVDSTLVTGTAIEFSSKIGLGGVQYLRTAYDSRHHNNKAIPLGYLIENYSTMTKPRTMRLINTTHKLNPTTGSEYGGRLEAGTEISFSSKVSIGGAVYLRTEHDTSGGYNLVIPYSYLENAD